VNADGLALAQNFFRVAEVHHLIGAQLAGSILVEAIHTHVASGIPRKRFALIHRNGDERPDFTRLSDFLGGKMGFRKTSKASLISLVVGKAEIRASISAKGVRSSNSPLFRNRAAAGCLEFMACSVAR
jgi:hypothetical protein